MAGGNIGTDSNGYTLSNQATITGYGTIGSNFGADYENLNLNNSGTIDANSSGNTLTIGGDGSSIARIPGLLKPPAAGRWRYPVGAGEQCRRLDSVRRQHSKCRHYYYGGNVNHHKRRRDSDSERRRDLDAAGADPITISDGSTYTAGTTGFTSIRGVLNLGTSTGGTWT